VRRLRLLVVTQGYAPAMGGTERAVQRLAEELVAQFGDEVTVFTTNCFSGEAFNRPELPRMPVGTEVQEGVRVRRFPVRARVSRAFDRPQSFAFRHRLPFNERLRTLYQGPIVPGLARAVRAEPCDVVAASSFPLLHMYTALRAARGRGLPCVFFYGGLHPHDEWGYQRPMIDRAIRGATCYVASTPFERDYVCARGADPRRVRVISLGVDAETFATVSRAEARAALDLPEDAPVVGFIGQLGLHKGVDTLLRAMPLVWGRMPRARLVIAGARAVFASEIDRTIASWPEAFRRRVLLRYGFDEAEKPLLYAALDALAYPSGFESFGMAFLEAWAAGKPVVGCPNGAVPFVVDRGRTGLLVPFQDEAALAAAILALLGNPGWARALGERGRRRVQDEMTWDRVARRFRDTLVDAVDHRDADHAPSSGPGLSL
jgi:glycosyltransferase involved in cell wall biosynthesis